MAMSLTKEILAKQIQLGTGLDFDVAVNFGAAGEAHRVFVADERHARQWIGNWVVEAELFEHAHRAGVVHALSDLHTARAALGEAVAINELVDASPETVDALMDVDASLDGLLPQVRPFGNFNFLVLFDKLDDRHIFRP